MEKSKSNFWRLFLLLLSALILPACGGDGDDDGGPTGGITSVDDKYKSYEIAYHVEDKSVNEVIKGAGSTGSSPYNKKVVNGITGTATITGSYTYTTSSSSNCVSSTSTKNITEIVFNNYQVKVGNTEVTLTGTITYYDYYYSQQCGLNYSSSCSTSIRSVNPVKVKIVFYMTYKTEGYEDTVSFNASAGTCTSTLKGSLTASNGVTYSF
jgi:hypothetical protein